MNKVVELVNLQAEERQVAGVIEFDRMTKRESFIQIEQWIYNPRIVRKQRRKVQSFSKYKLQLVYTNQLLHKQNFAKSIK